MVKQLLTNIRGPQGPEGPRGPAGPASTVPGPPGDDGQNGQNGQNGRDGVDGVGTPGKDGTNGLDGRNGVDGKNGLRGLSPFDPTTLKGFQLHPEPPILTLTKQNNTDADITPLKSISAATSTPSLFTWIGNGPNVAANPPFIRSSVGSGTSAAVEFETDAPLSNLLFLGVNTNFSVFVDGMLTDLTNWATDASGAWYMLRINWSGVRKMRRYKIYGARNLHFGGLRVTTLDTVLKVSEQPPLIWGVGDSYQEGSGAVPSVQTSFNVAANALGYAFLSDGIGGASFTGSTGGGPLSQRINEKFAVLTQRPVITWTELGLNHVIGSTPIADVKASVEAGIARYKALAPDLIHLFSGPHTPVGNTDAHTAVKNVIQDAVNAAFAGGLKAYFVDLEGIVTVDNKSLYTLPDNVHPTVIGHVLLGLRKAEIVNQILRLNTRIPLVLRNELDARPTWDQAGVELGKKVDKTVYDAAIASRIPVRVLASGVTAAPTDITEPHLIVYRP